MLVNRKANRIEELDSIIETERPLIRLLRRNADLRIPLNTSSRLIISSTDVIHSFAVPSIGLKVDAIPGRINQLYCNPSRLGVFYGQCSEICGSNHSFIPIRVNILKEEDYNVYRKIVIRGMIKEYSFSLRNIALS